MTFVDLNGTMVNLAHVKTAEPIFMGEHPGALVEFADGSTKRFKGLGAHNAVESFDRGLVIPAAPGFMLLRFWFHEAEPNKVDVLDPMHREPIIAWRIADHGTYPVGLETSEPAHGDGEEAILRPDGIVLRPEYQAWPNIDEWADHVCTGWKKWLEKQRPTQGAAAA